MKNIIRILFSALLLQACSKEIDTETPALDVRMEQSTVKAGEAVRFLINSDANVLSFYSGEVLKDYEYRAGRVVELDSVRLSFSTSLNYGTQKDQFAVFISNDFNGDYTADGIKAATWQNITSLFKLAPGNSNTAIPAGVKNITEYAVDGKPLYIGYRFIVQPQTANGGSKLWTMSAFSVTGHSILGSQVLADHKSAGWHVILQGLHDPGRGAIVQAAQLAFYGNNLNYKDELQEDWVISKALETGATDMGPDWGTGIKTLPDPQLESYEYTYEKPGKYIATFVGKNVNSHSEKQVIKQVAITVTP